MLSFKDNLVKHAGETGIDRASRTKARGEWRPAWTWDNATLARDATTSSRQTGCPPPLRSGSGGERDGEGWWGKDATLRISAMGVKMSRTKSEPEKVPM